MILGLLGDVHGNDLALEAVLEAAERAGVQKLLVTGDLVGYYFAPGRVLELLEPWDRVTVRGNHEDMLAAARVDRAQLQEIERRYGSGVRVALETLSRERLDMLCALPRTQQLTFNACRLLLCHGAPWDTDQYVYPNASAALLTRCAASSCDFVVMGHTHYPMVQRVGAVTLINPGSVGQPRHRRPGACWATLDTDTGAFELRSESYDMQKLVSEAQQRHPEIPYLAEVLRRT